MTLVKGSLTQPGVDLHPDLAGVAIGGPAA